MIAVDTNLLVYAHRRDSPFHMAAKGLITDLAEDKSAWAIPWPCVHEYYSIVTHPRIYSPPSSVERTISQIEAWSSSPSLHILAENELHWGEMRELLGKARVQGPLVHDARVAALCLSHGISELWSTDRDFSRFPRLRVRNPLVER